MVLGDRFLSASAFCITSRVLWRAWQAEPRSPEILVSGICKCSLPERLQMGLSSDIDERGSMTGFEKCGREQGTKSSPEG